MLSGAHSCIVCIAAAIARNLQTYSGSNALDVAYNRSNVYCVQHTIKFFDCVRRTVKNTNFTVCKGVHAATNAINDCHINYDPARLNQRNFFNNASIGWGDEQPCRSFVFTNFCSAWSRSGGQQNSGVYSARAIEILKFHQIWSLPSFDRVCRLFARRDLSKSVQPRNFDEHTQNLGLPQVRKSLLLKFIPLWRDCWSRVWIWEIFRFAHAAQKVLHLIPRLV